MNEDRPKVSVIIPVYNAGLRLRQCIESILAQTLKNIEIIFVLDCPTDGSDSIVENYSELDNRISIIRNTKNLNIGESRNVGILKSRGEYLAFCDHDDIVNPLMYEKLYEKAIINNADMVLGCPEYTYKDASRNNSFFYPKEGNVREQLLSCIIGRKQDDNDEWNFFYSHGVIWDNIYRRDMVVNNHIKYVDNNQITFEDNLFMIECLISSNKAIVHNEVVYQHTIEESNTASTSGYTKPSRILSYIEYLYKVLSEKHLLNKYEENFCNSSARYMIGIITRSILKKVDIQHIKTLIKQINSCPHKKFIFSNANLLGVLSESKSLIKKIIYSVLYILLKVS